MKQSLSISTLLGLLTITPLGNYKATAGGLHQAPDRIAIPAVKIAQLSPPPPPPNSILRGPTPKSIEQTVFQQINEYRAKKGLSTLTWDAQLATKARTHSKGMADKVVPIGHDGFENRVKRGEKAIYTGVGKPLKKPLEVRVKNASKRISHRAAENVAYNMGYPNPAAKAVQGWLTSNGHRQNIEGQYTVTGVGVSRNPRGEYYFTQIFIQK